MEENITQLPAPEDERDRIWEENHKKITECIGLFLKEKNTTPSISYIVSVTQLNWRTVKKHIQEFSAAPAFKEEAGKYRLMTSEILGKISSHALYGNVKAARLFMELMGMLKTNQVVNNNFINGQTNYIEVNGVKITREVINGLSRLERLQIEDIISASLHNKELEAAMKEESTVQKSESSTTKI